jgi:gamma-glutamylcyclotransferase (GGCT)/AIG2-like uncharacterized protein YtfP
MTKLFSYGDLKKRFKGRPMASVTVFGELRECPDGFAAARFDSNLQKVHGVVLHVTSDELQDIDRSEVNYTRVEVMCSNGEAAQAYQYNKDNFDVLPLIKNGKWSG